MQRVGYRLELCQHGPFGDVMVENHHVIPHHHHLMSHFRTLRHLLTCVTTPHASAHGPVVCHGSVFVNWPRVVPLLVSRPHPRSMIPHMASVCQRRTHIVRLFPYLATILQLKTLTYKQASCKVNGGHSPECQLKLSAHQLSTHNYARWCALSLGTVTYTAVLLKHKCITNRAQYQTVLCS